MCGIVGLITNDKVVMQPNLLKLLKKLEYRGYDSAGLAYIDKKSIIVKKQKGEIDNLKQIIDTKRSKIGISHTRWATHGEPSKINAHPLLSQNERWAVVHNGIVENYLTLIQSQGNYKFSSQTDSEVFACLLQKNSKKYLEEQNLCIDKTLSKDRLGNIYSLINTCNVVDGSFALLCLNNLDDTHLYLAKRKSPLYILKTQSEVIVASDIVCFEAKEGEFYQFNDDEFCVAGLDGVVFFDKNKNIIDKTFEYKRFSDYKIDKGNFRHFMYKEILEEGKVLNNIITNYQNAEQTYFKFLDKTYIKKISKIVFVGCGTAYHACLMGAEFIKRIAKIDATAFVASEYRYSDNIFDDNTLFILVSQSGETADTLAVCEMLKKYSCKVVSLTNVLHSTLKNNTQHCLPIFAGPEIAVASTKAYIAQLAVLFMLAHHINNIKFNSQYDYISKIQQLSSYFDGNFDGLSALAEIVGRYNQVFFMGRGLDYITCLEASLKLKEVSYISTSAYPAGELKHGFLALVDKNVLVIVLSSDKKLFEKTLANASEVVAREGKVVLISPFKTSQKFDYIINLPLVDNELSSCILSRYLQMLAYLVSTHKGINPDKPRNLAKSVTVE